MVAFPANPRQWNTVTVTNNIIADNVAGWDGAGISLLDSTAVNIVNNTIAFNSSTASAGPLFNTMGAPLSSTPPGPGQTCPGSNNCTTSTHAQVAGVVAIQNSAVLRANLPTTGATAVTVNCPPGHFTGGGNGTNGNCRTLSVPKLENNVIWHNNSYYIGVGAFGTGTLNQQHLVALLNASGTAPTSQTATGQCVTGTGGPSFWDIGVRGDTGPTNHSGGATLAASDSVLTPGGSAVTGGGNSGSNPNLIRSYCDGSRTPPEAAANATPQVALAAIGWQVPPGISDATVPNPIFNLMPSATVDEGNNWVNLNWGPLSMTNPTVVGGSYGNYGGGLPLGNYGITTGSSAAGRVTNGGGGTNFTDAPAYDFYNTPRKPGSSTDAGAVRLGGTAGSTQFTVSPSAVDFGSVPFHFPGATVDQDIQVINTGSTPLTFANNGTLNSTANFNIQGSPYSTCAGTTLGAGQSCVINVVFVASGTSQAQRNAILSVTANGVAQIQTVALSGHDTIATISVSPLTPALTANPANTVAVTGTRTITNTITPVTPTTPNGNPDAGPYVITAITLTRLTGTGTFTLGGTCAVGTPINEGGTLNPPAAGSSCTVTVTYTPPVGATGTALNGSAHLTVTGYGTASTAPIINATFNAN
jgi:hypothetical protein